MKPARLSFTLQGELVEVTAQAPAYLKRFPVTRPEALKFADALRAALGPGDPDVLRAGRAN